MSKPRLQTYTLNELQGASPTLRELEDPHGFLARMTPERVAMLQANPAAQPTDLALILTVHDGRVAGILELCAGFVTHRGVTDRTHWLINFHLDPDYRTTGSGGLMLMKAVSFSKSLLACGAPSPDTEKLYAALKFVRLGPLVRYVYFLEPRVIVEKFLPSPALARALGRLGKPVLRGYYAWRGGGRPQLEYEPIERFDERFDQLKNRRRQSHFPLDAVTMNWVSAHTTGGHPFLITRRGEVVGYCLYRLTDRPAEPAHAIPAMRGAALLDYFVPEDDPGVGSDLLRFGIAFCREQGADLLECQTQEPLLAEQCRALGMIALGGRKTNYRSADREPVDPSEWLIVHGTADVILDGY